MNSETTVRNREYYPVKQILAVSVLGLSYSEMISGFEGPEGIKVKLDATLKYVKSLGADIGIKYWKIEKAYQNRNSADFIVDYFMVNCQFL